MMSVRHSDGFSTVLASRNDESGTPHRTLTDDEGTNPKAIPNSYPRKTEGVLANGDHRCAFAFEASKALFVKNAG